MRWTETALAVGVVLLLVLWVVWVDASRLDRLHRRVDASRGVLDAQLLRRATAAAELATSGLLDPVSSIVVGEAAWAALSAGGPVPSPAAVSGELRQVLAADLAPRTRTAPPDLDRGQVESDLTAALRVALADPQETGALSADPAGGSLLADLSSAWYRVQLARRFHNDAVAQTRAARRGLLVRLLRLAGSASEPVTFEVDDEWPDGLPREAPSA